MMTETTAPQLVLPQIPRRVTPRAARRAWAEAPVQFWWKSAIVIAAVAIGVGAGAAWKAVRERWLLENGLEVNAKIIAVRGITRLGYALPRDDNIPVTLRWTKPDGVENLVETSLPMGKGYAKVGEDLPIRVDPDDASNWVEVTDILPWWRVLTIPLLMMLPISILLMAIALIKRWGVLKVWRVGHETDGVVVDLRNASTAPRSRVVRYTVPTSTDKRIFRMLYPIGPGLPQKGETFRLLALRDKPKHAIAAALFADPPGQA